MKSFSVFLLAAVFVIFIVSEVKCSKDLPTNNICVIDEDCESEVCRYIADVGEKFCVENDTRENINLKVEHGNCTYLKSDHINEETKALLIKKFTEFHAAHALIPTGTRVTVTRGNMSVTVVIDNRIPSKGLSSSSLELSDEAANALNIWKEGTEECDLQIDEEQPSNVIPYILKPVIVVVVYMAAIFVSSYW